MAQRNKKQNKKGRSVLARKPHGSFIVGETQVIDGQRIQKEYLVLDFTSRSL